VAEQAQRVAASRAAVVAEVAEPADAVVRAAGAVLHQLVGAALHRADAALRVADAALHRAGAARVGEHHHQRALALAALAVRTPAVQRPGDLSRVGRREVAVGQRGRSGIVRFASK